MTTDTRVDTAEMLQRHVHLTLVDARYADTATTVHALENALLVVDELRRRGWFSEDVRDFRTYLVQATVACTHPAVADRIGYVFVALSDWDRANS
jgi:hypothetical protein